MSHPWSALQSRIESLFDPALRASLQCRRYRMASQMGSTDVPRYWLTLDRETLWDYPRDFPTTDHNRPYPYVTDVSAISDLVRLYIDAPVGDIILGEFPSDVWGLTPLLRALDRRVGRRRWPILSALYPASTAVQSILRARQTALGR
jgi:hypothetical protein